MRLRSLKYEFSFFSKNENDVNLAVASTAYTHILDERNNKEVINLLILFYHYSY